ncbi:alkaline phosphatase family protein [Virgibacillus byunsanensis]|uniref:Alkaline phosphatase family protein n=1 Tax=Virgibacillus byunsanensis TaxID=570945 RepID=A0ABW3LTL0_9BACI
MIKKIVMTLIGLGLILFVINWYGFSTPTNDINSQKKNPTSKPVVFIIMDSLMDKPLQKAIQEGRAPAMKFLSEQGQYLDNVVTSYPTMSVTIDSSLLTGTYADEHRLPGLVWFNQDENRLVNYGSGKMEVFQIGIKQVLNDNISNLNQKHLSEDIETIYENLDKRGERSASVNGLVYRGNQTHNLHVPKIASGFNLISDNATVKGPPMLSMGVLSQFSPDNDSHNKVWQGLGLNDAFTAEEIKYLTQENSLPTFTLGYFPDLDHQVHNHGPMDLKGIEEADQHLQTILDSYPTWEETLENMTLIVYGDSAQSEIGEDRTESIIDLTTLSEKYQVSKLGEPISKTDQVVLAVNERMAYINLLDDEVTYSEMISDLIGDPRIEFISWKDLEGNHVSAQNSDGKLTFRPDGVYTDLYDQSWDISGDFSILDIAMNDQSEITYGDFPDGLARLHGALHSHKGRYLIIDAKPGYEFVGEHSPTHLGGAGHGSLHAKDSLTPMIIAGTDTQPKFKRIVDFKEWLLEITR